ncbi:MAG: hypothetical protein KKF41_03405 [Actinobacteria bacterium]|nr:hypothetical protein [Actinomycetota bacterium]MBU1945051.1 hypothetical protein [Actinomycetota bacterium]MBU2686613.1 hypothetical protein [Actinomycetota bacterium]
MPEPETNGIDWTWRVAISVLLSLLLCAAMAPPLAGFERTAAPRAAAFDAGIPEKNSSYFNTDMARRLSGGEDVAGRLAGTVPEEYLPRSVLEGDAASSGGGTPVGSGPPSGDEGSGTGGWTTMARPFTPSAAAGVNYTGGWGETDTAGRMHLIYERYVTTDISEAPDAPGFRVVNTKNYYYTSFAEGTWTDPVALSALTGKWSAELVMMEMDSSDNLHVMYTTYEWRRDPTRPAGTHDAYYHRDENLWYRYHTAAGEWSAPTRLSGYSGNWEFLSVDAARSGNSIQCGWVAVLNNETVPSTYRAQVVCMRGFMTSWDSRALVEQWDFNRDPGQLVPDFWLSIDISETSGEAAAVYAKRRAAGALYTGSCDVWATTRPAGGTWSAPARISNTADNYFFVPIFVIFPAAGNRAVAFCFRQVDVVDATHAPRLDYYFICRDSGGWRSPENLTGAASGQVVGGLSINLGPFGDFELTYDMATYTWTGGTWQAAGSTVKQVRETPSGVSGRVTVLPYQANRFLSSLNAVLDRNGSVRLMYTTFMQGAGDPYDYGVYYTDNVETGAGGAFSAPVMLRATTDNTLSESLLSVLPDGSVLATWFEERYDAGTGAPLVCMVRSRLRSGAGWASIVDVTAVPGSADLVHGGGWPSHYWIDPTTFGEQQCIFETAKYNVGAGTYYDFKKYYAETTNGAWSEPENIPAPDFSGSYPDLYDDGNQRWIATFDGIDPATGKTVPYASGQREPTPPGTTFFFAEGTTREGFDEWICIQNPGETQANVVITYMLETGENLVQEVTTGPHARSTIDVKSSVGPGHDVSARVESDVRIIAERPMYFNYGEGGWTGGHDSIGALGTSRLWYFAEGTTRSGFAEYLTIQNPSDAQADVTVTYVLEDGSTQQQDLAVGPRTRATVDVNAAVGPDHDVSMVVECPDVAVVAERPMYFSYGEGGWTGGHDVMGSPFLSNLWYFAEGTTRGGFDTYLCVQNPNPVDADVTFTFILEDGSTSLHTVDVPATSRQTLKVNDVTGPDRDVSVKAESSIDVLVERPMYFDYHYAWTGGHVTVGARAPRRAWYLAEGTTREGFDEWICIQNPGNNAAVAGMNYMLEDGSVTRQDVPVPAHTRVTVDVRAAVGSDRDVSTLVWSDAGVIVERPMYFNYHNMWTGGHDVVGL